MPQRRESPGQILEDESHGCVLMGEQLKRYPEGQSSNIGKDPDRACRVRGTVVVRRCHLVLLETEEGDWERTGDPQGLLYRYSFSSGDLRREHNVGLENILAYGSGVKPEIGKLRRPISTEKSMTSQARLGLGTVRRDILEVKLVESVLREETRVDPRL